MRIALLAAILLVFALLLSSGCVEEKDEDSNVPSPPDLSGDGDEGSNDAAGAAIPSPPALPD